MQNIKSIADLPKFGFRHLAMALEFEEQPPVPSEFSPMTVPFHFRQKTGLCLIPRTGARGLLFATVLSTELIADSGLVAGAEYIKKYGFFPQNPIY